MAGGGVTAIDGGASAPIRLSPIAGGRDVAARRSVGHVIAGVARGSAAAGSAAAQGTPRVSGRRFPLPYCSGSLLLLFFLLLPALLPLRTLPDKALQRSALRTAARSAATQGTPWVSVRAAATTRLLLCLRRRSRILCCCCSALLLLLSPPAPRASLSERFPCGLAPPRTAAAGPPYWASAPLVPRPSLQLARPRRLLHVCLIPAA